MTTHIQAKSYKFSEPLIVGGIVVLLSYAVIHLLAVSPLLIRVLAPFVGS